MSISSGGRRHGVRLGMERFLANAAGKSDSWHRKVLWVAALAGLTALAGGCAAVAPISSVVGSVSPATTLQIFNTTELRLQQKNFVVVKPNVLGESKGFSLLGLITLVPAKFTVAMKRLDAQADLKPGSSRALSNLVLEKDATFFILFSIPRTAVCADVIEFVPDVQPQPPSALTRTTAGR